jgi:hypothetical protein
LDRLGAELGKVGSMLASHNHDAGMPKSATIHIILQVRDDGQPSLLSQRRAVVTIAE